MNFKLRSIFTILLLGSATLLLVACGKAQTTPPPQENDGKMSICHANGKTDAPYDLLTLEFKQLGEHSKHANDIVPAPVDGCPTTLETNVNNGKISICHASNSTKKPYNEIIIAFSGLNGHGDHKWDIIPAPKNGCPGLPTPTITRTPTMSKTPTITRTPTITKVPSITQTPVPTVVGSKDGKITICHATGGGNGNGNGKKGGKDGEVKYVMITISVNGLNGHNNHAGDIIPAPAGGCP